MKRVILLGALSGALAVAGCYRYDPRAGLDAASPEYQAALAACQEESVDAVNKRNAKTGIDWVSSPVRRPFQIREAIRGCVAKKGYAVAG